MAVAKKTTANAGEDVEENEPHSAAVDESSQPL